MTVALPPFLLVIIVSIIRDGIEDYKKTKYDLLYNNSPTTRWNTCNQNFEKSNWSNVYVGEILKINKNEIIPCDLLVIKSSAENGYCYLETTNLDGESALKPRESPVIFQSLIKTTADLPSLQGVIEVDHPNNDIYTIEGTIFLEGFEKSYFDINNVILRAGSIKECRIYLWSSPIYRQGY